MLALFPTGHHPEKGESGLITLHQETWRAHAKAQRTPLLRIFLGPRTAGDWISSRTPYFSPTPSRLDGSSCLLLPSHRDLTSNPLAAVAARHALWSAIFNLCREQRFPLRWSHLPLLGRRDQAGSRPQEPYEIDLSEEEPHRAWHALRLALRREPTTRTLHAVAVLQECDRVAALIERTTGTSQRVFVDFAAGDTALHETTIEVVAHRTAERLLNRWPALGSVRGGFSRGSTAAERYVIREMTQGAA